MNGVKRGSNENNPEGLEREGERAVIRPMALCVEGSGDGDGKTGYRAFDGTSDGGSLMSLEIFLGNKLKETNM